MTEDHINKIRDEFSRKLNDHLDDVQIWVTWEKEDGDGNWFSRVGMAEDFLWEDDARTKAKEIQEALHPPDV